VENNLLILDWALICLPCRTTLVHVSSHTWNVCKAVGRAQGDSQLCCKI